jgi:xanthine dehydrogenase molybdopterin-binding subunit B
VSLLRRRFISPISKRGNRRVGKEYSVSTDKRNFSIVGQSVPRVDGAAKVTGSAKYVADLTIPGMLEGKFLRSPYAHARIRSIDSAEAKRCRVCCGAHQQRFGRYRSLHGRGKNNKDQPIIATNWCLCRAAGGGGGGARPRQRKSDGKIHVVYEELPAVIRSKRRWLTARRACMISPRKHLCASRLVRVMWKMVSPRRM